MPRMTIADFQTDEEKKELDKQQGNRTQDKASKIVRSVQQDYQFPAKVAALAVGFHIFGIEWSTVLAAYAVIRAENLLTAKLNLTQR